MQNSGLVKERTRWFAVNEKAAWRELVPGDAPELDLPEVRIRYFEADTGSPIV
jgi:hypothetical protein